MSKEFNRGIVDINVAYEEDLNRVLAVLNDEMQQIYEKEHIEGLLSVPAVLGVEELGESSIKIRISADCMVGRNWDVERSIRLRLKNRFDKEGIEIPYNRLVVIKKKGK